MKIVLVSASILSSIALVLLIAFRKRYYDFVSNYITKVLLFVTWLYSLYTGYSKPGKIFLWIGIIVLLIRSLWYAQNFSIQFDEAWNYNLFLSKNLFYSLGAYNNYPLHNVITWFFIQCFGNEVMVLRFPSVLIGLILIFTVALLVRSITKNECLSISLAFLIACLPIHVFYMMYARGVLFEIYFSLLISYVLLKTNHDGFTKSICNGSVF
ncbi:MAG: glycosyltransferase family 39 protein [Bacteroidetes bacterium]|nr:glycosyltransferase family 39 protein [Bacteroidota bacterium]